MPFGALDVVSNRRAGPAAAGQGCIGDCVYFYAGTWQHQHAGTVPMPAVALAASFNNVGAGSVGVGWVSANLNA